MQELVKRLRNFAEYEADLADESKWERIEWEAADLIESQAAEIEKYKALCDQMATVMTNAVEHRWPYLDDMRSLIEEWRVMRCPHIQL